MSVKWKAAATAGIWLGIGLALGFGNLQESSTAVASSATAATFFVWFFG